MATAFGFGLILVIGAILFVVYTRSSRDIKIFNKNAKAGAADSGPPALPRSSAAELTDAGPYDWRSVLNALNVPPDEELPDKTGEDMYGSELGLRTIMVTGTGEGAKPNVVYGNRQGRHVEVRIGQDEKVLSVNLGTLHLRCITIVGAHCPSFALRGADSLLKPEGELPSAAEEVLLAMKPSVVWNDVRIVAGDEGLVANRPLNTGPYNWVYDLWLLERLADHIQAPPRPAPKRWTKIKVPYGMGTWT